MSWPTIQTALLSIMITAAPSAGHGADGPIALDRIHCEQITRGNVRLTRCTIRRQARRSPTRVAPRFPLYWTPQQIEPELDIPPAELELPEEELDIPATELELPEEELDIPATELELPEEEPSVPNPYSPPPPPPTMGRTGANPEQDVLSLLNQERIRRGSAPLRLDPHLAAVARAHSQDMCRRGYFAHRSPDGRSPWDRLKAAGIQFRAAAENIAVGYRSARTAHDGWMTSPGHRANRLNPGFTRMGVGLVTCQGQVPYWTEVFAR